MQLAGVGAVQVAPLGPVKMEDRKRPASDDQSTPPSKRQAVAINGTGAGQDTDVPWRDDLDRYQKDAILRQMREFKREKTSLEEKIAEMNKKSRYHDDHLRVIDAWLLQLLDEITLISSETLNFGNTDRLEFSSSLLSADTALFEQHILQRSSSIRSAIKHLFGKYASPAKDIVALQERLAKLLASEKEHAVRLHGALADKNDLSDRLESASYRYMLAEKKLDRARSAQVAKIEAQAIQASRPESNNAHSKDSTDQKARRRSDANGTLNGEDTTVELELARDKAIAEVAVRAGQITRLQDHNKTLTNELTALRAKMTGLTDDDYASSDLCKHLKSQHDENIKRLNDLEATNIQLREEAKQLRSERTTYREEADNEVRSNTVEMQSQLAQTEADLARIRHARDELIADQAIRKSTQEQNRATLEQMRETVEARQARINALETEVERLRLHEVQAQGTENPAEGDQQDSTILRKQLQSIRQEREMIEAELTSMASAWKKAQGAANKKLAEVMDADEKISRISAEKAKADQKYFAAMKMKDTRDAELRMLKAHNAKSTEIVTQLKESEGSCRALLSNLEKQLADAKDALSSVTNQHRASTQSLADQSFSRDQLAKTVEELKKLLSAKDISLQTAEASYRQAQIEASDVKIRLDKTQEGLDSWKKKGIGSQSEEYESLRAIAICNVCNNNFKNTTIKTCGHVFCQSCAEERLQARSRKCPNCGRAFGSGDLMRVTL